MGEPLPSGGPAARARGTDAARSFHELAQAFLTLEHSFLFYPPGHQAREAPLARLAELLRVEARDAGEGSLGCAGDVVLWRGEVLEEPPAIAGKLAAMFGSVGISRLEWTAGVTDDELRRFMTRVAAMRGAGRRLVWEETERYEHLRAEGPDYQALMGPSDTSSDAERRRDLWRALLLRVLGAGAEEPTEADMELLRESWGDPAELAALISEALGPGAQSGDPASVERVRHLAAFIERAGGAGEGDAGEEGAGGDAGAQRLAAAGRQLPPRLRLSLLEAALEPPGGGLFAEAFAALPPGEEISLLGLNFSLDPAQIERLAKVFQHLVPRQLDRMELAPQLRDNVRAAADPDDPLADNVWEEVQELLTGEAGDFMSPSYREQLRRLAIRESARRDQEAALGEQPALVAALAPGFTSRESLLIQLEHVRLATNQERYHDALSGLTGLCSAALAAGDAERGLRILQQLLALRSGEEPLAGPRSEIGLSLKAIAGPPLAHALAALLPRLSPEERASSLAFVALAAERLVPPLLDALAEEQEPAQRREILALLEGGGSTMVQLAVQRLGGAPPPLARLLLGLVAETADAAAAPTLLLLLAREDQKLRRDALRVLVRIDSEEVRRALPRLLDDADPEIVQMAAAHLGAVGSPETVRELLRTLDGGYLSGRRVEQMQHAIFVLGRMRATEAVAPLGEVLLRRVWINRRALEQLGEEAARALARIGNEEARRALEAGAARGAEKVAALCRRLLARQGG